MDSTQKDRCRRIDMMMKDCWFKCKLLEDHDGECIQVRHPIKLQCPCNKRVHFEGLLYYCCLPQEHSGGCLSNTEDDFCIPPPLVWGCGQEPSRCTNKTSPDTECGVQFRDDGRQYTCILPAGHRSLHCWEVD